MLELKDVTISYNDVNEKLHTIISGLSFKLSRGQVLGITGGHNSTNTFIIKAIIGKLFTDTQFQGRIFYDNKNIQNMSQLELNLYRKQISVISSLGTSLDPVRKIRRQFYDILGGNLYKRKEMDMQIVDKLKSVHIGNPSKIMELYPFQLDVCTLQRISIAVTICKDAKLIIANNCTANLDNIDKPGILREFMNIRSRDVSMIYFSDNITELSHICNDILVLKDDKVSAYSSVYNILKNYQ